MAGKYIPPEQTLAALLAAAEPQWLPSPPVPPAPSQKELTKPANLKSQFEAEKIPESSFVYSPKKSHKILTLSYVEQKALDKLKSLVQDALDRHIFTFQSPPKTEKAKGVSLPDEVSLWGVPLLKDNRSDVTLLKFLRARDFNVDEAFDMLKNTMQWRKEYNVDKLIDEDLGNDLSKAIFMLGQDKEGHPVCYNVFGEFQNEDLNNKMFADEEKRMRSTRWKIQSMERSMRKLDFSPGGISTFFVVNDLKNSPGFGNRNFGMATEKPPYLLENYPEIVEKLVMINVSPSYMAVIAMTSSLLPERTKNKFVFARPSESMETLLKYISPEHLPIQYGGLCADLLESNPEFTIDDPAKMITLNPGNKRNVEIILYERCGVVWELRVLGWDVSYSAEFVPNDKNCNLVIIHRKRRWCRLMNQWCLIAIKTTIVVLSCMMMVRYY